MKRAYFDCGISELSTFSDAEILGTLSTGHAHALELLQRDAWIEQIAHLREVLQRVEIGHLYLEFAIPRMGKRADCVLLVGETVAVLEYKVGARTYDASALRQVVDYALDLKNFHETSHARRIVPVLVATDAPTIVAERTWSDDQVATPICANRATLPGIVESLAAGPFTVVASDWEGGRYKPTPTIVEAATALYRGHSVEDISRSEAGVQNLTRTFQVLTDVIERAKADQRKAVCLVTGVPGSGKTLAGLNLATQRTRSEEDEHAVFLSGNGPLVTVLREALARNDVAKARATGDEMTKAHALQKASAFIQNIHHFRDEALQSDQPPVERVVVFDEAQRAWDVEKTASFMKQKRRIAGFSMSEPEFLISAMDRHNGWCVVVCLVGHGQEIHTGEAGIGEWVRAIASRFSHWRLYFPPQFTLEGDESRLLEALPELRKEAGLHLDVSVRSFRAERLCEFVAAVVSGDAEHSARVKLGIVGYPLRVTRDLSQARSWLRDQSRGGERYGLVASSNALRLKPEGIHVKAGIATANWFLDGPEDVRSSLALEDAASEFEVQGLELDWVGVCWDANLRYSGGWLPYRFSGSRWAKVTEDRAGFLINSYRVLLTRARQGMVVFVPKGDERDATRPPEYYDGTYRFLVACGFEPL